MANNPIIYSDFPDVDIMRVGDTYYLASTTMHFFPGGAILRSFDLMNWEWVGHVFDALDNTDRQRLVSGTNIYGQGMWAPSFRYRDGQFYLLFSANDTKQTYLFTASQPEGPWQRHHVAGFYHDASLFFDNGKAYLVYGNTDIYLIELAPDLSGPGMGGLCRLIVHDDGAVRLGYEGSKLYRVGEKYYLFLINWPDGDGRRQVTCLVSDSLTDEFTGGVIINNDLGFFNQGVAQGGIVDSPDGDWYGFFFQDRGAVGRVPVIAPLDMSGELPRLPDDKVPHVIEIPSTRPSHLYAPLNSDDDYTELALKPCWEFNHQPDPTLWSLTQRPGYFRIITSELCTNLSQAKNTLTQRTFGPRSAAEVTIDASNLRDGDIAGLALLQGAYSAIAVTRDNGEPYLTVIARPGDYPVTMGQVHDADPPVEFARVKISDPLVTVRAEVDFTDLIDEGSFAYLQDGTWQPLGGKHKLYFKLDHFVGCRFALFMYATQTTGGYADFTNFRYHK